MISMPVCQYYDMVPITSILLVVNRYTGPKATTPDEDGRDSAFQTNEHFWGTFKVGMLFN